MQVIRETDNAHNIIPLTRDLCAFPVGVVSDANEAMFARIAQETPLELHRFASGEEYNGWTVPQNWRVKRAAIIKNGKQIFDGTCNPLAVAYYSKSFSGVLDWEELKPYLVTHPKLPHAHVFHCMWQYRPWQAEWAMCIPRAIYETMGPGEYRIELETEYTPGEMLVGVHDLRGETEQTIVFNAHTCHPHMANDGFSGVATSIRLVQWLARRKPRYSYRLVFGPEHLGTVFYLNSLPAAELDKICCGAFIEMTGTTGPLKLASTFLGGQLIDRALAHAAKHHSSAYVEAPWRCGAGNDETVWEAPGYEVPFTEVTRCIDQFDPFPEYHTNLDTPESLHAANVDETFLVLQKAIEIIENNAVMHRRFDGLICLSNPRYDLYLERPDPAVCKDLEADSEKWGHLLDCLFRYFNGSVTILDIAERHDLPFDRLYQYIKRFESKDLVRLQFAPVKRLARSKAETR